MAAKQNSFRECGAETVLTALLTTRDGAHACVVVYTPLRLKRSSRIAASAAITMGTTSGWQPAIPQLEALLAARERMIGELQAGRLDTDERAFLLSLAERAELGPARHRASSQLRL